MNNVVIAGAGPNGLMLAGELGLAGMRPVVLEPLAGPNPQRRANGITGQAVRLLDHLGLYSVLAVVGDVLDGAYAQRRTNGSSGQAVRLLGHRGLFSVLAGTSDPPQPSPW